MKRVLVIGAKGEMGRRIVRLADKLLDDVQVVLGLHRGAVSVGREARAIDILGPRDSIARALDGIDAVINAVGPYRYDPTNLLMACLDTGCHYVDLAEMPEFINRVSNIVTDEFEDASAPSVVTGCSTIPALVQVLAQSWRDVTEISEVRIFLSVGSANPSSLGLLYSILRPMGRKSLSGERYFARLVRKRFRSGPTRLHGRYPSILDTEGISTGQRLVPAKLWFGFDRSFLNIGLSTLAKLLPRLGDRLLLHLIRLVQPLMPMFNLLGTSLGVLSIEGRNVEGEVMAEIELRARREGLDIPALPSVWAVRRLLEDGRESLNGLVALDRLVSAPEAVEWLGQEGFEVVSFDQRDGRSQSSG